MASVSSLVSAPKQVRCNSQPERLRAVVVDDSPTYTEVVCALLEMDTVVDVVGRASDGAEAIHLVAHLQPELLIMDVEMPLVDGLSAAAFVSMHFPTTIVLMSANNSLQLRNACLECGADAFIHKPDFRQELARILCRFFAIGPDVAAS